MVSLMIIPLNINDFFCPNEVCTDHGKKGVGNITISNRYGRSHRRLLKCKTCNSKFSERKDTLFYRMHTQETKIKEVIEYLLGGMSYREAATAAEIDKDTVQRIWLRFLESCEESLNELLDEFNIKLEDLIKQLYNRQHKKSR
jgi:LacI family transcriptional regulator